MTREDYIHSSMLIRMEEKKLLKKSKIEELIDSDISFINDILSNTVYDLDIYNYDYKLKKEEEKLQNFILNLNQNNKDIIKFFLLETEYQNFKINFKIEKLNANLEKKEIKNHQIEQEYIEVSNEFEKDKNLRKALIKIDKLYLQKLYDEANNLGIEILKKYANKKIDMYNLLTIFRLKKENADKNEIKYTIFSNQDLFLKYIEQDNIEILSNYYGKKYFVNIDKIKDFFEKEILEIFNINITYGPEIIISYYIKKMNEINKLKKILTLKTNNIDISILKNSIME